MVQDDASGGLGPPRAARILEALFTQLGNPRLRTQPQRFVIWATAQEASGRTAGIYAVDFRDGDGNRFNALWAEPRAGEPPRVPDVLG
jgi:hypothetical protein